MNSESIRFRPIRDFAPDALAPLLAASVAEGFRFVARLAEAWGDGTARFDAPRELLLGGYDGVQLLAVGGLTADPYGHDADVGRLRRVYVLPAARRRGVGRQLVRALELAAVSARYHALVLRTDTEAAARFYETLGYLPLPAGGTATHRRRLAPGA